MAPTLALVCTLVATSTPEAHAQAQAPARILVLDVAGDAVTKTQAGAVRDRLAAAVARRPGMEVLSMEDVRRVLDVEGQKQAAGCAGQSDCLAEIGAALGADGVLYASVVRLGEKLVVSLSLVDPRNARSVGRDSFEAQTLDQIADDIPSAAERVFGGPQPSSSRPVSAAAVSKPFPVLSVGGAVVAAIGAIATGAFGYVTYESQQTVSDPNAKGAQKTAALRDGPTELGATFVSAGVCGIGAVVFLFGLIVE